MGEHLKQVMRRWPSGVAIAIARHGDRIHGMTVNSFTSVSVDPPCVTVTMANNTRTRDLVEGGGHFGICILSRDQVDIADRFAGKDALTADDRFQGLTLFSLLSGTPLLMDSLAQLDCRVVHRYPMQNSTLYVGQVLACRLGKEGQPLQYLNRAYLVR